MTDDAFAQFEAAEAARPREITFRVAADGLRIESDLEVPGRAIARGRLGELKEGQFERWSSADRLTDVDQQQIAALLLQEDTQKEIFSEAVDNAVNLNQQVRIVITTVRASQALDLDALPWEAALYFMLGSLYPFAALVSFVRRDNGRSREQRSTLFDGAPLRILSTYAHHVMGYDEITTLQPLRDKRIRDLGHELQTIKNTPSVHDLFKDMVRFDVFHFSGHGTEDALISSDGPLPGAWLGPSLKDHGARLAVLVACRSASDGEIRSGRVGVAWHVRLGVPAVIGMQREIESSDAAQFVNDLYDGMGIGGSVDRAFAAARELLHKSKRPFWIPVLHLAPGIDDTSIIKKSPKRIPVPPSPPVLPALSEAIHAVDTREQVLLFDFKRRDGIRRSPAANPPGERDPSGRVALSSDGLIAASMNPSGVRVHWVDKKYTPSDPILLDGIDADGRLLAVRSVHSTMVQALVATEREMLAIVRLADGRWSSPRVLLARPGIVAATWVDRDVVYVDEDGSAECLHSDPLNLGLQVAGVDSVTVPDGTLLVGWGTGASGQRAFTLLGRAAGQTRWEPLLDRKEDVLAVGIVRPPRVLARPGEITLAFRTEHGTRLETIGMQWTARF